MSGAVHLALSLALAVALGLEVGAALAVEIRSVDVSHDDARYRVSMRVALDAPADATYSVFTDLPRLRLVNPAVRDVKVLGQPSPDTRRVYTELRACVSLYCRRLKQVQDMQFESRAPGGGGKVRAQVIAERSDFRFGNATWDFRDCGGRTCLDFDAELEPNFWVPPLIGPWLIKRKLQEEAIQTSQGLERLARPPAAAAPTP